MHTSPSDTTGSTASGVRSSVLAPAFLAALLGAFIIFGVGFSHLSAAHNAAHDMRHSNGFPCH
jgi:cobalt transporter subunit CbtB